MQTSARPRLRRASAFGLCAISAVLLAACTSTPQPKSMIDNRPRSKEYFAESEYGVKASPRVAFMRRGGGRDQLGKPYQVRGKWYYPKEDKKYAKVGLASWYGDAFHGRLTANGEVYDTAQLTAAHPTMPLPSYARVTNLETGSSIIVRVNDRGPYHEGRIIDVSERAAQMLDYGKVGTAKVKVEYVGRAPLDGNDDQSLMASYRPGNRRPDPSDGLPTGVMVAMNGPSPSVQTDAPPPAVPFPGQLTNSGGAFAAQPGLSEQPAAQPAMSAQAPGPSDVVLPDFGPIVPERPEYRLPPNSPFAMASLSYADERVNRADVFAALDSSGMSPADILQSWKKSNRQDQAPASDYVAAGSFDDAAQAKRVAAALEPFGRTEIQRTELDGNDWYAVNVYPDGHGSIDDLLQAAWSHGAPDALVVRN
ncbi:septal ring lytic transglycosylase RlpA family protein [Mesorhizobium sp. M1C.F.Ca.ET.193.01.1.1]|uniref:septal ring lytic transglycosylase RlpA family protein n=1 Tax=unclassified Mesorhizobium TaxID=325217 RepID=UPI000FD2C72D|nr:MULTISPECIES: septal ring lytic transglycosylase RlpA family protein [unclassified Mesorhizobium]TGT03429.1 septal ring lytic transglycosylase RlpA family protein [bacterium M00.F.Ca.ET.177.01.1.1]TGQ56111.1 septal ring lytic transglycosylase RlpA family protein [Mesorhizobium sp. M1C.F.Ca.ET.210.01.1.1]TGQ75196.1 septal ring lytic transglycosylase RlpA family protein [Mesorhizobium sp. M1C.F.Ca.ET.212.01.1.1]TGR13608.1 septal ring lytic transglycosylase RlpA family protein [Mesorhizobium sp